MNVSELLKKLEEILLPDKMKVYPPASSKEIKKAEQQLGINFPQELVDVLMGSNGLDYLVDIPKADEPIELDAYVPVKCIVSSTIDHIKYSESIEVKHNFKFLCFAGSGCEEYFGYKVFDGKCTDTTIYVYYPIEDRYKEVAKNFEEWAIGWLSGKIKI